MKRSRMGWLVVAVCALTACGGSDSTPTADASTPDASTMACRRGFEATVQSGPNAGTTVMGTLVLTPTSATQVTGYVDPGTAVDGGALPAGMIRQRVPVTGVISGNQITLTLMLPNGSTMTGTGTLPGSTWSCPASDFTGTLTGPGAGDTGDWTITISGTVCATVLGVRVCVTANVTL